jgi:hypothetical protein
VQRQLNTRIIHDVIYTKDPAMNVFKKMIVSAALVAMIGASVPDLAADETFSSAGGFGYEQSRRIPSLVPAIALGTITVVAIVAVAVQNSGHHHHGHSHD